MTRKRRTRLILGTCSVVAILTVLLLARSGEPTYEGRTLSDWLIDVSPGNPRCLDNFATTQEAVHAIGTNAIPYLLEWVAYAPPPSRARQVGGWILDHMHPWFRSVVPAALKEWVTQERALLRAGAVPYGFDALGLEASSAVGQLAGHLTPFYSSSEDSSPPTQVSYRALQSLSQLGPTALPPLLPLLTNDNFVVRTSAILYIGCMGTNALPAIPGLIDCLQSDDPPVVSYACQSLARLQLAPDIVVPALAARIQDNQDSPVSLEDSRAFEALAEFGPKAVGATPALTNALASPDPDVRRLARDALQKIAPEVLTDPVSE